MGIRQLLDIRKSYARLIGLYRICLRASVILVYQLQLACNVCELNMSFTDKENILIKQNKQ